MSEASAAVTTGVTVVGIGEDGWDGLGAAAQTALHGAPLIVGSGRQLALLPELGVRCAPLPSPLLENLDGLVRDHPGLCLLASGDPMLHGIGATLARRLPPGQLRVIPGVSSLALACARLGWPEQDTEVISLVSQLPEAALAAVAPGARLILLCRDGTTPVAMARLLAGAGWGDSELTVLERLGGPAEQVIGPFPASDLAAGTGAADAGPVPEAARTDAAQTDTAQTDTAQTDTARTGTARTDTAAAAGETDAAAAAGETDAAAAAGETDAAVAAGEIPARFADLCVLAVRPAAEGARAGGVSGERALAVGRLPGLPDEAFETDGQITRRELRVLALTALRPGPGELLWDVGAGSGSIGIEWLRAQPLARAIAVEARADRAGRAGRNAAALGVPGLRVVCGSAPGVLAGLPAPDAVFVGGGVTTAGLLEACWERLAPGGRLVAHAVTVESEAVLHAWQRSRGGRLTRSAISYLEPLGSFTTWRPALPVTQWTVTRHGQPDGRERDGRAAASRGPAGLESAGLEPDRLEPDRLEPAGLESAGPEPAGPGPAGPGPAGPGPAGPGAPG